MRVATFNVLHGRSLLDGLVAADRLARACASLDADVVCLQEIDRGQPRSGGLDQTAAVAEALGAAAWRFEAALVGEPGARWRPATDDDERGGEPAYGVGIVSRRPVVGWRVLRLAAARVRSPVAAPGGRGGMILLADEPRVALAATLEGPSGPLEVATTHLSFVPGHNVRQLRRLGRELGTSPGAVLAGDLNLPRAVVGPALAGLGWRSLVRAATFPAAEPRFQLDHVLARGPVGRVVGSGTVVLDLSDHRAVVVELAAGGDGYRRR